MILLVFGNKEFFLYV